jgi:hypothetical protein
LAALPKTRTWPVYRTVRDLVHAHVGKPAVVMGGGPSLPAAIERSPEGAIFLSANEHGCRFFENSSPGQTTKNVVCLIVALDQIEHKVSRFGVPIVSRHMYADYRLVTPPAKSSGVAAAYIARLMGCAPILLAGMDCYDGATYFDDPKAPSTGRTMDAGGHAMLWREMIGQYPGGQYRVIGGNARLQNLLGMYDPTERPRLPPVAKETLTAEASGIFVEVVRSCTISMRDFRVGERLELNKNEAEKFIKLRSVKPVRL